LHTSTAAPVENEAEKLPLALPAIEEPIENPVEYNEVLIEEAPMVQPAQSDVSEEDSDDDAKAAFFNMNPYMMGNPFMPFMPFGMNQMNPMMPFMGQMNNPMMDQMQMPFMDQQAGMGYQYPMMDPMMGMGMGMGMGMDPMMGMGMNPMMNYPMGMNPMMNYPMGMNPMMNYPMMNNPMMNYPMGFDQGGMNYPMGYKSYDPDQKLSMYHEYKNEDFPTDYTLPCSDHCACEQICRNSM
jgi:hypothetical protein